MSRLKLTEGGKSLRVTLRPKKKDAEGKLSDALVDGAPSWTVQEGNGSVVQVTPAEDGKSAIFAPKGPGAFSVLATADADLGAGVKPISISFEGDVESAVASQIEFEVDEVDSAPAAPPVDPPAAPATEAPAVEGAGAEGAAATPGE